MGRLFRRGKVWWYQFRGKRVSTRCTDRKAAELAARELERLAADPTYRAAHQTTLHDALAQHVVDRRHAGRAPETVKMIELHAGHFVRVLGKDELLASITPQSVDRYIQRREAEGAHSHTVYKELSTLRGALRAAKRRREFRGDLDELFPTYARKYKPRDTALSLADVQRLLAVLPPHRRAVCAFIVATAADLGSVFRTRPGDIDLDRFRVRVRGSKTTHRDRVVPVMDPFRGLLEQAAPYCPFAPWGNVRRDLYAACLRAGVQKVSPRDLRRSSASILRALGVEPSLIAPVMGHADSRMVERVYGRLSTDSLERLLAERTGTKTVHRKAKSANRGSK